MRKPDDALSLLKELVIEEMVFDDVDWCFFCGAMDEGSVPLQHEETCVWERTKVYLRNLEGRE